MSKAIGFIERLKSNFMLSFLEQGTLKESRSDRHSDRERSFNNLSTKSCFEERRLPSSAFEDFWPVAPDRDVSIDPCQT